MIRTFRTSPKRNPVQGHHPASRRSAGLQQAIDALTAIAREQGAEAIAGIESRGFLFGVPVALALGLPFVPIRKPGKLGGDHAGGV